MEKLDLDPQLITHFERVYIHRDSWDSQVARRVRHFFSPNKIECVTQLPHSQPAGNHLSAEEFNLSKKQLYIQEFKGRFFKRCPGAKPGLTCCNYFVLNLGIQCNMNCTYCYLQSFINSPFLTIYSHIDQAIEELRLFASKEAEAKIRVGTGETIDSLSLDDLTLYSRNLISFFKEVPQWRLEFKTKSNKVQQFLDIEHKGNVIVSWSLNPQAIIEREELGTAGLIERLEAARKCRDHGFLVAFHLDPVIWHPDWKENYSQLVETISYYFKSHEVLNLSLGALRFQPEQRHMMRERFGSKSYVTNAEMFRSQDGKYRYDQDLRKEMFEFIMQRFKEKGSWNVFLCMETKESWMGAMTALPKSIPDLDAYFDHRPLAAFREHRRNSRSLQPSELSEL
ncbi:MAG: hypothetical protein KDD35_02740 [Bdellovibrionales bacterium]|nr:hypothetical protein [Bdellovibrionales bacterium]